MNRALNNAGRYIPRFLVCTVIALIGCSNRQEIPKGQPLVSAPRLCSVEPDIGNLAIDVVVCNRDPLPVNGWVTVDGKPSEIVQSGAGFGAPQGTYLSFGGCWVKKVRKKPIRVSVDWYQGTHGCHTVYQFAPEQDGSDEIVHGVLVKSGKPTIVSSTSSP